MDLPEISDDGLSNKERIAELGNKMIKEQREELEAKLKELEENDAPVEKRKALQSVLDHPEFYKNGLDPVWFQRTYKFFEAIEVNKNKPSVCSKIAALFKCCFKGNDKPS